MPDSASRAGGSTRLEDLAAELRRRKAELDDQRKEISVLIKQTGAEFERAAQRARETVTQLRTVESNPGSFSHAEVKRAYSATQEAQMRQFMMQTQLDQFRSRQTSLGETDELLSQLAAAADEMAAASVPFDDGQEISSAQSQAGQASLTLEGAAVVFRGIELALQRLSHQLQDETAQTLSDLILRAEVCERLVEMDKHRAKAEVTRLKQAAAQALKSTRQLAHELRTPTLDEAELSTALRRYVEVLKSADKQQVDLQVAGPERTIPAAAQLAAFRIVQEALTNASTHSGSKRAEVRLRYEPARTTLSIADDGSGFDVEAAIQRARANDASGLVDMQLRAELVGGTLDVSSMPGSGCTITLTMPV